MRDKEITVMDTKGQILIPEDIRRQLAIKPKNKLAVYRKHDKIVVTIPILPAVPAQGDASPMTLDDS